MSQTVGRCKGTKDRPRWRLDCNGASTHAAVSSQPHKEEDARALVNLLHPQGA